MGRFSSVLDNLYATSRHVGLNVIQCAQKYTMMSVVQTQSLSHIAMMSNLHAKEVDAIIEEIAGKNDSDMREAYNEATKKAYGFLWVRLAAKHKNEKFFSSFTKRIEFD